MEVHEIRNTTPNQLVDLHIYVVFNFFTL